MSSDDISGGARRGGSGHEGPEPGAVPPGAVPPTPGQPGASPPEHGSVPPAPEQPGALPPGPQDADAHAVPPAPEPTRPLLRRSREDRVLFGVAGGLGRYLGVDPVLVRIAFVLLALFGGSGLLLYLIGLIAIPEERPGEPVVAGSAPRAGGNTAVVIGVVLVFVGSFALLRQVLPGLGAYVGPLLLILLGVLVVLAGRR